LSKTESIGKWSKRHAKVCSYRRIRLIEADCKKNAAIEIARERMFGNEAAVSIGRRTSLK